MPVVFRNIALIILYFAAGQGAWCLAVPPYYASLFWPSAGIALAFTYLYGYRVLPGVFLGAGILALFSPLVEEIVLQTYFTAVGLAIASTLQAYVGVYLLKRFFGADTRFHSLQSVILFTALAALSCFVSATLSFATFYILGSISFSGFLGFWQPWFIGDVMGVLVVAPLLILILNRAVVSLKRKLIVSLPVLVMFLSILFLFENIRQKDFEVTQQAFHRNADLVMQDLRAQLELYRHDIEAVHSLFLSSDYVDHDEFQIFTSNLLKRNGGIFAFGWAPYIADENLDVFLEDAMRLYGEGYSILEEDTRFGLVRSSRQPKYLPLYYVASEKIERSPLGFDLLSDSIRKRVVEKAKRTRALSSSEPITLVADSKDEKGFLLVDAFYEGGANDDFSGVVVGAFYYRTVIDQVMNLWRKQGLDLELKVLAGDQMTSVYQTGDTDWYENIVEGLYADIAFEFANQKWLFSFYVDPDFYYGQINYTIWYVLIAALVCLYFFQVCLLNLTGQTASMEESITAKTKEISHQNKFLSLIMDTVPDMIFVKDKDFKIVQGNKAFFEMYPSDEREGLIGTTGLEHFPPEEQEAYLVNDKIAFEKGVHEAQENNTTYKGGVRRLLTRKVSFQDEAGETFLLGYSKDITDLMGVQRKLEAILDTTADGLITIRENGIVETYNKACEKIFGYSAEEVIGNNINMLMPEEHARDHGSYLNNYLQTGEKKIIGSGREVMAKRKDGSLLPVDLSVAEVQLGGRRIFSGILRDISERRKAEELSQQIAQIFNTSTIEFYIFDADTYELVLVNDAAASNMGYSEDELIGQRPSEFVKDYKDDRFSRMTSQLLAGEEGSFEFETCHQRKDGSEYDVLATMQLTQFKGRPAFIASMLDVTERNKVFEELKRSNKELESFAYVTSHDLKAPLRHISMSAGFFKEKFGDQLDDKSKNLLDVMMSGTDRMQNMIESLLEYSRVGRDEASFSKVSLNDAVQAARQNLSSEIFSSQAFIEVDLLPTLYVDRYLMVQLFQNLLQNSLKYRKEGEQPRIKILSEEGAEYYEISVLDNGIGIDPAYAEKIFQIFQRLHRDNEYEGVGIGLSICQRIVEFHDGWIALDKSYVDGCKIVFSLPKNKH